jgi:HEAT repeat protein
MMDDLKAFNEAQTSEARNDPRATQELIAIALTEPDEDAAWDAVVMLQYRGTKEVFDEACQLCASACPQERTLGANILGQLGIPKRSFPKESVALLRRLLEVERDEDVLDAICIALGHIHDPTAIPSLVRLKAHPSAQVRFAVVYGLLAFEDPLAIKTLIGLSSDPATDVRDWATFGLGTQIDADTPEIRAGLLERVYDKDEPTRGEALVGLARRHDQRVIEPLIKELEGYQDAEYTYSLEAAEEIGDPRLLPVLTRLKQSAATEDTRINEAIHRCSRAGAPDKEGSLSL